MIYFARPQNKSDPSGSMVARLGQCSRMTPEQPMEMGVDTLRRLIAWERRMGKPVNRAMFRFYEWAFVLIGPFAVGFGLLALVWGFSAGGVLLLLGLGMTWVGWTNLIRLARSHLGRED